VPVGPGVRTAFLADTIESVRAYLGRSYFIVLLNDSGEAIAEGLLPSDEGIVLDTHGPNGALGGLFICKCFGIEYAVKHFRFRVILALDTDALIIGPSPDIDAIRYFEAHPAAAILGSFRKNCRGQPRDFTDEAGMVQRELEYRPRQLLWEIHRLLKRIGLSTHFMSSMASTMVSHYRLWGVTRRLREPYRQALASGYSPGDHCLGGATFMSPAFARKLYEGGYLSLSPLRWSLLGEDHIFGLLAAALGMELHDFNEPDGPMSIEWKGMPDRPESLLQRGSKIVHSTRYFEELGEAEIRRIFESARTQFAVRNSPPVRS
jgi:hypothetical protein